MVISLDVRALINASVNTILKNYGLFSMQKSPSPTYSSIVINLLLVIGIKGFEYIFCIHFYQNLRKFSLNN